MEGDGNETELAPHFAVIGVVRRVLALQAVRELAGIHSSVGLLQVGRHRANRHFQFEVRHVVNCGISGNGFDSIKRSECGARTEHEAESVDHNQQEHEAVLQNAEPFVLDKRAQG